MCIFQSLEFDGIVTTRHESPFQPMNGYGFGNLPGPGDEKAREFTGT
jgi:hypothetical protein